jgi:hypothetical protein
LAFAALGADEGAEKEAIDAANEWLALVDEGDYTGSWNNTAAFFKAAVKKEQWHEQMKTFRAPLGSLVARKVKAKQYTTSLPGAPDGEYVVIQYQTSFENKKRAVETVTPMKDEDGKWRVSGYYIK